MGCASHLARRVSAYPLSTKPRQMPESQHGGMVRVQDCPEKQSAQVRQVQARFAAQSTRGVLDKFLMSKIFVLGKASLIRPCVPPASGTKSKFCAP